MLAATPMFIRHRLKPTPVWAIAAASRTPSLTSDRNSQALAPQSVATSAKGHVRPLVTCVAAELDSLLSNRAPVSRGAMTRPLGIA